MDSNEIKQWFNRLNSNFQRMQFGTKDSQRIYLKLIKYLRSKIAISDALMKIEAQESRDGTKNDRPSVAAVRAWREAMLGGTQLNVAMTGWVSENDRMLIGAGEKSGDIASALEKTMMIQKGVAQIRGAIIGSLAYPAVLIILAIVIMIVFGHMVVPVFEDVLPRSEWQGQGAAMGTLADFVKNWLFPCLGGIFAGIILIFMTLNSWTGRARVIADRFPPWSLFRLINGSGFILSVSFLLKAKVSLPDILTMLADNSKSAWYRERLILTLEHHRNGANLGEALYLTGMGFPDEEMVDDLRAFATFPDFAEMLDQLGSDWIVEAVKKVQMQGLIMKNAGIFLVTGIFGFIGSGMMALFDQIKEAAQNG